MAAVSVLGIAMVPIRHHFPLWLFLLTQVLPTISAALLAAVGATDDSPRYRRSIVAALLISFTAGVAMGLNFLAGVGVFFLANMAYLTAFTANARPGQRILPFLAYGLLGGLVLAVAWNKLPTKETLPIIVYGLSIISVASQAVVRSLVTRRKLSILAAVGATLLFTSDSAIGLEKYGLPFSGSYLFIMSTYFIGQWLIAMSVVGLPWKR
jgi:uncharacterized membrane protein YhhN